MAELRIAVLGAGNIGATIGKKWLAAGHQVTFGVRNPSSAKTQTLRSNVGDNVRIGTTAEAVAAADIVLFAVPGAAMDETIAANAAALDGKIIIDSANRIGTGGPLNSFATFQAQTPNATVYRAFNILGWENFENPVFEGVQADLFYCGPDGDARQIIDQLISDVGLRPIRLGDADLIGIVDSLLPLWFTLMQKQGWGRTFAFKVLTR